MILAKDIVTEEIKSLHEKSLPVELPIGQDDVKTLYEMLAYLINSQDDKKAAELNLRPGVGLAAPQIGVNKCMFVVFATDEEGIKHTLLVVNPKIIKTSILQFFSFFKNKITIQSLEPVTPVNSGVAPARATLYRS